MGKRLPIRLSSSLLMLPACSAIRGAEIRLSFLLSTSVAISPTAAPGASVISTASWSIQMRPTMGAVNSPIPHTLSHRINPRQAIGIANRQIRDPAVPFGLEGSSIAGILPLGTSLINATLAFRASTGRRSSCKAVCSPGALSTPYRVPHPYIVTSQFRIIQQPIAALDVHIVSALSPGGYRYIPK